MSSGTQRIALGLRRRDMALLQELVEEYQYCLVRYVVYLLGNRRGVEDVVHETWLRVLERGATYDGLSRFEPWLFTISHKVAIDDTRQRWMSSSGSNQGRERERPTEPGTCLSPSPFALGARTEDAPRLAVSLETLEPVYREALVLRFQEGLSLQEISSVTGAPVSTVAARIYRSLAKLRDQLEVANHGIGPS